MLTVTPAALECLFTRLDRKKAANDVAMRFTRKENGWKLRPGRARPDDTAFSCQGRTVLVLDPAVVEAMSAMTLDVRGSKSDAGLKLHRNARGSE